MSIDNREKPEPIQLTEAEYARLVNAEDADLDNPEFSKFLSSKGIALDMGDIEVQVEGKIMKMTTARGDFGTTLMNRE